MSSLLTKIEKDCEKALKKGDKLIVSTLRLVLSAAHEKEIEKRGKKKELTAEDVSAVVRKEAKKRRESIAAFEKGDRQDLVEKEKKELAVLENYLPEPMKEEELKKIIEKVIEKSGAEGMSQMGKVMGQVMVQVKGKAEGGKVSRLVKEALGR